MYTFCYICGVHGTPDVLNALFFWGITKTYLCKITYILYMDWFLFIYDI